MTIDKHFYGNRVALNVLANSVDNAKQVYNAAEGYVLIGVLSKQYSTVDAAVKAMKTYGEAVDEAVSIGLGGGDNRQASVVADIAKDYAGSHVNQVFPAVGVTRANLGEKTSWINGLVSPSGHVGYVNISTGPASSEEEKQAIVPIESAIALIRDMGGNALKYFPMKGLAYEDEYREVARVCGKEGFALEPTGGINKDNIEQIIKVALEAKVPKIIPHVYSSIIDKDSGATNIDDVRNIMTGIKNLVDNNG